MNNKRFKKLTPTIVIGMILAGAKKRLLSRKLMAEEVSDAKYEMARLKAHSKSLIKHLCLLDPSLAEESSNFLWALIVASHRLGQIDPNRRIAKRLVEQEVVSEQHLKRSMHGGTERGKQKQDEAEKWRAPALREAKRLCSNRSQWVSELDLAEKIIDSLKASGIKCPKDDYIIKIIRLWVSEGKLRRPKKGQLAGLNTRT